ncbi:uncharacterized protein B0H18DRAFT_1120509 [Fomitopsis serialis]|uniref:uncharacterized protein n=1 Tax=Fomitopsis serialis TaxID=139415 RepID=UPI002007A2E2|nr:uncharacterized protein B0H18DRAFT_1120509 [Neoantrodia serialis]KAH9923242.1 hypothetical protein B0H18DRAFT_1120509 [Neoantrodia serialis]
MSWFTGPTPPTAYLASVPASHPLFGLMQPTQYLATCRAARIDPGEMRENLQVVLREPQERNEVAVLLRYRGQQAFPVLALESSTVEDLCVLPHNAPKAFVVTGPARALYGLVTLLRKVRAPNGLDQSKIPFSQRKPVFSVRFLVVGVLYHSEYLRGMTEKLFEEDLGGEELWTKEDLGMAVYHTETGLNGRGVCVIVAGDKSRDIVEFYDAQTVNREEWWSRYFVPRLVRTSDGKIHLETPFPRLLGKPPITAAGVTPMAVKAGFISVVLAAGYHVEKLLCKIPAGVGITLNSFYINPRRFGFQFPSQQKMRRHGLLIEGLCLAAGNHSTEKAADIFVGLKASGVCNVSLKPGFVDGIRLALLVTASRVMVAKQGHTSSSVKDLIVAAKGVDDSQRERTYAEETSGIVAVKSELGEPIHKAATRAVKLWKEFDDVVLKMARNALRGSTRRKKDGSVVEDIADMAYGEVVFRTARLMYVKHEERRSAGIDCGSKASILQSCSSLDKPVDVIKLFFATHPEGFLSRHFVASRPEAGAVHKPFIPVLDANFEVWFKKDFLWAAGDIEAVFDQGPQRVCILQGPVAMKHATKKDEPIKEMLDNIPDIVVDRLAKCLYDGDLSRIPTTDYLVISSLGVERHKIVYSVGSALPEASTWLETRTLAGPCQNWLRALLTSTTIVQGTSRVANPMCRLFALRRSQTPVFVALHDADRSYRHHRFDKAVEVKYHPAS